MTNEDWKGIIYVMFLVSGAVKERFGELPKEEWKGIHRSCNQKCMSIT